MAKATKIVETIVEEKGIVLELTIQEAEVLRSVLHRIGGDPVFSPRQLTNCINDALEEAGVKNVYHDVYGHSQAIYFQNYKKEIV